jgi:hypothetical protein
MNIREEKDGEVSLKFDPRISIHDQIAYMFKKNIYNLLINFIFEENNELIDVNVSEDYYRISKYSDFSFVTGLYVIERSFNIEGISAFKGLKTLSLNDEGSQELDFSPFILLECLRFNWRKKTKNLGLCIQLKELVMRKYNKGDLTELKMMKKMELLSVSKSPITNLSGIEDMQHLDKIDFYSCPKLTDISNLRNIKTLTYVDFTCCKQIREVESLAGNKDLEIIRLMDCGEIESLQPLAKLPKLRGINFYGSTVIKDGDLSGFEGKALNFIQKKHYTHKLSDFPKLSQVK